MAEPTPKFDARLEEGVKYFEQMLQLMPDDRITLEFLVVAYEQLKEPEKSRATVISLAKLLIKQGDFAAAADLLPRLEAIETDEAKVLALRIRRLAAPSPELVPEVPRSLTPEEVVAEETRAAIESEVALVELLKANGVLTDAAEAARLREQVSDSAVDGRVFLVSALAILEKENSELCEKCLAFLADRFATPPVPIAAFERKPDLLARFPSELLRIRGAVPFAAIGETSLVALVNPADEKLRARLSEATPCRFYLALPSAVESWLDASAGEQRA